MDTVLILSKPQEGFLPPRLPFLECSASRSGKGFEGLGILLTELLLPLGELGMTLRDRDRVAVSHPGMELSSTRSAGAPSLPAQMDEHPAQKNEPLPLFLLSTNEL